MTQFTAFIDEAGDEGYNIVPPPQRRSSEWFVLTAAVCETRSVDRIESLIPEPFHFRKAKHHDRVGFIEKICDPLFVSFTAMAVIVHKPSISSQAAARNRSHYLFDYATKLLLERISWYCDEHPSRGSVQIIFSRRGQLNLDRINRYLERLIDLTVISEEHRLPIIARNSIRWGIVRPDSIDAQPHDSMAGLRIADAVASGCASAIEWSPALTTEHRYLKMLKPKFYRKGARCLGYGIKFIPDSAPDQEDPFAKQRFHFP